MLEHYQAVAPQGTVELLRQLGRRVEGKSLVHVNSTRLGGGVAEILHRLLPLFDELGIKARWEVMTGSDLFYRTTKSFHNALQGTRQRITPEMYDAFIECNRDNAKRLNLNTDFAMIHDPQPAALIQVVDEQGWRKGTWLWRCHIDLSAPYHPVWQFFAPILDRYDAAIFTAEEYARPEVEGPTRAFIPPSIDPLSPKNAPMSEEAWRGVIEPFGVQPDRPLITQVSRFDPWKDPLGVIDAFRLVRKEFADAQLVLAGSLAHDDPEGMRYLDLTTEHAAGDPDIHVLTNLDGVGDSAINALQRASDVVVQKSLREGFGLVVAEAMWKGKPVVGGSAVGLTQQIVYDVTGYTVQSVEGAAFRLRHLLNNPELVARMGAAGREHVRRSFLVTRHLTDYMALLIHLTR